jgi:hypothetical protein
LLLGGWGLFVTAPLIAQEDAPEVELSRHVAAMRKQIESPALAPGRRAELVLDLCQTLDHAAQATSSGDLRRRHWSEAVALVDDFLKLNPHPADEHLLRLQAGVYRWASGQSWQQTALLAPADREPRAEAIAAFDDAIGRLRAVPGGAKNPALADNLQFRLAEALADRASLDPENSPGRRAREAEAIKLLDRRPAEPSLAGFWHLLHADLLRRSNRPGEAEKELDAAERATPPPPVREVLDVRVPLLLAIHKSAEAEKLILSSSLPRPAQALWMVRLLLTVRLETAPGPQRFRAESELFRWISELRAGSSPESRLALLELARKPFAPDVRHPPEVWDALADAHGIAGEPAQAAAEILRAAERAGSLGKGGQAAEFRLRAGGYLFQAARFEDAAAELSRVAGDPAAGAMRPRAAMLYALACGRAWTLGLPGATKERYARALDRQIRDFPREPSTDEARWLRGKLALADSDREQAAAAWGAIARESPRWLEARLALFELDRAELERTLVNPDRDELRQLVKKTDRFLVDSLQQAHSEGERAAFALARARLQLTPGAGDAETAMEECERVRRLAVEPGAHYRAQLYRLVALVALGRYLDAEREARSHSSWRQSSDGKAQFDTIRLLDQSAAMAASEMVQRRFGSVLRLIVEPPANAQEKLSPEERFELELRSTRSLLFVGAEPEARRSLSSWRGPPETATDRLLRDLGDTYSRLEIHDRAIEIQRLRIKHNLAGSPAWFDARYALAFAYFRTGQLAAAARLIDGTQILHPELGGGALKEKFIRLRQRLGVQP